MLRIRIVAITDVTEYIIHTEAILTYQPVPSVEGWMTPEHINIHNS